MEKYGTNQHPEHSDLSLPLANPIRRRIRRIVGDRIIETKHFVSRCVPGPPAWSEVLTITKFPAEGG